jgi:hypothetical protein
MDLRWATEPRTLVLALVTDEAWSEGYYHEFIYFLVLRLKWPPIRFLRSWIRWDAGRR